MTPLNKILIANRGEIACRVIRTARRMGIATVAVYSDADRDALHVRMADEAVHIGPAPAAQSYLVIDKIIDAAQQTGADAVHPGYGFLSENPDFVRALDKAGITFIGPSATAIESMGLKDAAKDLMEAAGVPVTPGYRGEDQAPEHLAKQAKRIGYPVLIKAVAGGGGKGMRKVEDPADFADALVSCQREATASFGNAHVLIEKFITSPRHIEVQVFGDSHGSVVHMFERDCSLQRRHQKVIEEAPAPGMTEEVRAAMTSAAVKAAQAVNYEGAGTVEFIVDGSGALRTDGFWFMEMNTRLQVEHPVTEEVVRIAPETEDGDDELDLVEWQIRVARGERLPSQSRFSLEGHAIEARIYAEDPLNDFRPSAGNIQNLYLGSKETRLDLAYERTGGANATRHIQRVPVHYDPMIGKVIAHADGRVRAISKLCEELFSAVVAPLLTNMGYLYQLLQRDDFIEGRVTTSLIAHQHEKILEDIKSGEDIRTQDAIMRATVFDTDRYHHRTRQKVQLGRDHKEALSWRLNLPNRMYRRYFVNGIPYDITIDQSGTHGYSYWIDGELTNLSHLDDCNSFERLDDRLDVHSWSSGVPQPSGDLICGIEGLTYIVSKTPPLDNATTTPGALTAPMPGKVIAVNVAEGDAVTEGQTLVVLEAMKMEMAIKSPRDGVVASVPMATGAMVGDGDVLVELEEG